MNYIDRLTGLFLGGALFFTSSCQTLTPIDVVVPPTGLTLPASIDYHAEGTLSNLVYRSTFSYNAAHQLQSIRDSLITSSSGNKPVTPWAEFFYTNNRLTSITLRAISNNLDSIAYSTDKPARFELTYVGQTLNARLLIDNQEVKKAGFSLDQQQYPLKVNVTLGQLSLDSEGHLDPVAESGRSKARNPNNYVEILDQQYDQFQNVFAQSKEYQILTALLAVFNRTVTSSTGLTGLDNALTSNNLLFRTVNHCTTLYGCNTGKLISETKAVNSKGFPIQRVAPVGAMGRFHYTITYWQTE